MGFTCFINALDVFSEKFSSVLVGGTKTASAAPANTVKTSQTIIPCLDIEINTPHHGKSGKKQNEVTVAYDQINGVSIGVTGGSVEYRVHVIGNGWYSKITKCDWKTPDAYAGDLKRPIDVIQIYFHIDTKQTGGKYYKVEYQVMIPGKKWLSVIHDTNWENGDGSHTAGAFGKPIIAIRAEFIPA